MNTKNAFIYFGLLSLAFILMAGCEDSSKLSRSKAEKMIIEKFAYPEHIGIGIPLNGKIPTYASTLREADINSVFSKLQDAGLITYNLSSSEIKWRGYNYTIAVNLLDKSKEYVLQDWKGEGLLSGDKFMPRINNEMLNFFGTGKVVRACDFVFQKITGISFIKDFGPQMAEVEYTGMFSNPTPFSVLSDDSCGKRIGEIHNKKVTFQLYDDGWRIARN